MSEQSKTYNGWTNYETWAVGMWLDGNYTGSGTYDDVLELAETVAHNIEADVNVREGIWTAERARVYRTADALKEYFEDSLPEVEGIAQDLLRSAADEVNWTELAESKIQETAEQS